MAELQFSEEAWARLGGKVIVLTGGAQGIGAAAVRLAAEAGAHVYFGDLAEEKGIQLEQTLQAQPNLGGSAHFLRTNVTSYPDLLRLFEAAYSAHGRVDYAIANAAAPEPHGFFDPDTLDLETVKEEATLITDHISVNLTSVLHFCRIALAYLKDRPVASAANTHPLARSITLISSVAGITEAPGLFAYGAAKHGVVGLMRALRPYAPARFGVRVNALAPWATGTQLLDGVVASWTKAGLPINSPEDVARTILRVAADPGVNGCAFFVGGGRSFDVEEGIDRLRSQWMGDLTEEWERGQQVLALGDNWAKLDKHVPEEVKEHHES